MEIALNLEIDTIIIIIILLAKFLALVTKNKTCDSPLLEVQQNCQKCYTFKNFYPLKEDDINCIEYLTSPQTLYYCYGDYSYHLIKCNEACHTCYKNKDTDVNNTQ